jgi:hypothetical protein
MRTRTKHIAGLAAIGVLVGGGIAGAFAVTGGQDDAAGSLASALSARTGGQVSAADVKGAFTDVLRDRLAADVAAGRITQAQADQMLERAKDMPLPGMGRHGGPGAGMRGGMRAVMTAVEKKVGVTHEQLHQARDEGKTLAQVAQSKGVSRAELIATITSAIRASERGSGLTEAQATQTATRMADGTGPRGGHGRGHGGGHHGPGEHMPPQGP